MHPVRFFVIIAAFGLLLACAGAPVPQKAPAELRKSTRYLNKGVMLYTRGCYHKALEYFYESHERFTAADNLEGIANSLQSIANIYLQLNDNDSALLVYQEAIDTYKALQDSNGQARAWTNRSVALIKAGRLEQAAEALEIATALVPVDPDLRPLWVHNKALLLAARQQNSAAEKLLAQTLDEAQDADPVTTAGLYYTLGRLRLADGRPEQAASDFLQALALDRTADAYPGIARDLESLGICYTRLNRLEEAVHYQIRSAKTYALLQNPSKVKEVIGLLETNAARTQTDIRASLHWINQWLAGKTVSNLCR